MFSAITLGLSMLLFKNGKIICSGASSEAQIPLAIYKASKMIHEIQKGVKVQNIRNETAFERPPNYAVAGQALIISADVKVEVWK